MKKGFLALLILLLFHGGLTWAGGLSVSVEPKTVKQGEALLIRVTGIGQEDLLEGTFGDQPLWFFPLDGGRGVAALVGIDLAARPGRHLFSVEGVDASGRPFELKGEVEVEAGEFPIQRLTLPRELVELDEETLKRVKREAKKLRALWARATSEKLWQGPFLQPVEGRRRTSGFGVRRIINGQERSPHSGVDLAAARGTPVFATNAGKVVLVDEYFFPGRLVVLDHGLGLYTMYFHLQEAEVEEGQLVQKGQRIGRVGATGRATGPHLHFGARLNGARIDPLSLLKVPLAR